MEVQQVLHEQQSRLFLQWYLFSPMLVKAGVSTRLTTIHRYIALGSPLKISSPGWRCCFIVRFGTIFDSDSVLLGPRHHSPDKNGGEEIDILVTIT
jgi:hypothetical protein